MLPYWVVDAFTDRAFAGNPAAVVLPGTPLPDALMQRIAAENNLSETAFAVAEASGWRLRWFTPTVEVDLCGHATLATSFVLAQQGHAGPFRYHTRSGLLTATVSDGAVELDFPARPFHAIAAPEGLAAALGAEPLAVLQSVGLVAVLGSSAEIAALRPDHAAVARLPGRAVAVTPAGGQGADVTPRDIAPADGLAQDPVTGALHTQVVPYWVATLGRNPLTCHQASARGGTMRCELRGDRVMLRGTAVLYASGQLHVSGSDG